MEIIQYRFSQISSTNDWAKKYGLSLFQHSALNVVIADEQTAGRGREDRTWYSPNKKNIYLSFCLFLNNDRKDRLQIPQLLALTVAEYCDAFHLRMQLKWPNDLYLEGKKIGGILTEAVPSSHDSHLIVVGLGLNVNSSKEELQQIDQPATSLSIEIGAEQSIEEWIASIIHLFHQNLVNFLKNGFSSYFDRFCSRSYYQIGQEITLRHSAYEKGVFLGFNPDGSLKLLHEGQTKTIYGGEILSGE